MEDKNTEFNFDQIGFVVEDIPSFAAKLNELLGVGPFKVFEWPLPGTDPESFFKGKPASWRMHIGFADHGNIQFELIQPTEGESLFQESLDQNGAGLNHLRFTVKDFEQAVRELQQKGYRLLSCGKGVHGETRWAYFDTRKILNGLYLEIRSRSD
jgi:methylmalonyl-CoA/ethylmalonyl-CoA epimerase